MEKTRADAVLNVKLAGLGKKVSVKTVKFAGRIKPPLLYYIN